MSKEKIIKILEELNELILSEVFYDLRWQDDVDKSPFQADDYRKIIKFLMKKFVDVNLCNRKNCYRIVTRKNGVCDFCKQK